MSGTIDGAAGLHQREISMDKPRKSGSIECGKSCGISLALNGCGCKTAKKRVLATAKKRDFRVTISSEKIVGLSAMTPLGMARPETSVAPPTGQRVFFALDDRAR